MFSVEFTKIAEKQFDKLPQDIQIRIINILERIKIRPFHFVKRKEGAPYFIMRAGDYRAVIDIRVENNKIYVMDVGHRKNIYN